MNLLKREEYSRSIPNSRWLRDILEYKKEVYRLILTDGKYNPKSHILEYKTGLKISGKILKQCVRVVEGKPILFTEKQWDWLYELLLELHSRPDLCYSVFKEKLGSECKSELEEEDMFEEWGSLLNKYIDLFEKDINSFLKTSMPNETFRCVSCNKELEMRHSRIVLWSRNLADESEESENLALNQKINCIRILDYMIHWIETDKPVDVKTSLWNREEILMLLRNAYRILKGTPLGLQVFFDPYTVEELYHALDSYQSEEDDDVKQILEMLKKNVQPQMDKPLCWSCAGQGICIFCNEGLEK